MIIASIVGLDKMDDSNRRRPRPLSHRLFATRDIRLRVPEVESGEVTKTHGRGSILRLNRNGKVLLGLIFSEQYLSSYFDTLPSFISSSPLSCLLTPSFPLRCTVSRKLSQVFRSLGLAWDPASLTYSYPWYTCAHRRSWST